MTPLSSVFRSLHALHLAGVRFGRGAAPAGSASSVQTWAGQVDQHAAPPAPTSKFVQQLLQQAKMSGTEDGELTWRGGGEGQGERQTE